VLPGGVAGATTFARNELLLKMLKQQMLEKRLVAAICAAPAIVLTKSNLLADISEATCHPSLLNSIAEELIPKFKRDGEIITDEVVHSENCVTSRGPGTSMAFSLHLVSLLFSPEKE
jgi:protein deglycase